MGASAHGRGAAAVAVIVAVAVAVEDSGSEEGHGSGWEWIAAGWVFPQNKAGWGQRNEGGVGWSFASTS